MATIEDKFYAAVNVIQKLPKNGSFKPSNELMLRFYSYYKQATIGPCNILKPSFWDVVGKAKWDAWQSLGNMSKHEAMNKYVDEIKQIVETMPQTAEVSNFLALLGSFFELVDIKTGEKVANGQINHYKMADNLSMQAVSEESFLSEKDSNQPNIPKDNEESTVDREIVHKSSPPNGKQLSVAAEFCTANSFRASLGRSSDSDSDSEHFEDSSDNPLFTLSSHASVKTESQVSHKPNTSNNQEAENQTCSNAPVPMETQISEQLRVALNSMQDEMVSLDRRLSLVEKLTIQQRNQQIEREQRNWWPFRNVQPQTVMFILIWPMFVSWFMRYLTRKRRR